MWLHLCIDMNIQMRSSALFLLLVFILILFAGCLSRKIELEKLDELVPVISKDVPADSLKQQQDTYK